MNRTFTINEKELQKAGEWIQSLPKLYNETFYYKFIQGGIGYKVIVGREEDGLEKDITDYETW